jgi:D-glycero-alpha-D-manno-heptose-7-phosphate kinase
MIVSRAPVRFSLGGGGSDLPSYSREHGGFVVSAAVDRFVFVCVARRFYDTIRLAYSETETVDSVDEIRHRIFRAALKGMGFTGGLELHSLADVPANTDLGSSSSFTVALLNGLTHSAARSVPAEQLAAEPVIWSSRSSAAHREAGPVHRRLRRDQRHDLPPRRPGGGGAARSAR